MTFCGEASSWAKVGLVLLVLAFGLHCAGYGTNYWMVRHTARDNLNFGIGLWEYTNCSGSYKAPCSFGDFPSEYKEDYVKAVQAMESCGLIIMFVSMICLTFYVASRRSRTRGLAIAILILLFASAGFIVIGMIVWLACMPTNHYGGWSMGLTVFSSTLCITVAIMLIPDIRLYDYKDILKVGGEFKNLAVTSEDHPPPPPRDMYQSDIKPVVEPQGPKAAPVYQFLNYDKRRKMDGF
ncbi:hypothetical protein ACF0H5_013198 [Mactra antiquata]